MLILAAEGKAPIMFDRIGMLQALHGDTPKVPSERRKAAKKYRVVG
jgi:hypothetical protein